MNPLKSITGTIVTGVVIAAIVMIIFADGISSTVQWTVWLHALSGVAWIGLLYYFNFVQVPGVAKALSEADSGGPGPAVARPKEEANDHGSALARYPASDR